MRGIIHAAADVSDGLLGERGHILAASGVAARLDVETLLGSGAVHPAVRALPLAEALRCVLAGGDDYELVFTAPPERRAAVQRAAEQAATPVTPAEPAVRTAGATPRTTTSRGVSGSYSRVDRITDYSYVKADLRRLAITAAGILAMLVVLGIALP